MLSKSTLEAYGFRGKLWSLELGFPPFPPCLICSISVSTNYFDTAPFFSLTPPPPPFTPPRLFTTKQFVLSPTFWRIWERKCSNNSCLSSHLPPAGMGMLRTSLSECQMSRGCRLVPRAPRGHRAGPSAVLGLLRDSQPGILPCSRLCQLCNWEVLCAGQ